MKKIALITDGWGRYVTYTWIQGYRNYMAAHQADMDLYIFQSFGNFSMDEKHNAGEYNIARLPDFSEFDGILLDLATVSQPDLIAEIIERAKFSNIPAISLLEQIPGLYHSGIDNYEAITRIIEHLITEHGCRTLNFIGGPEFNRENQLRFKAYRDALLRHGIPFDEQRVIHHNYEIETGIQAFSTFKAKNLLPDAFVCVNDNTAVGVCLAAKEAGYSIPGDFLVTGFDNEDKASYYEPRITTVGFSKADIMEFYCNTNFYGHRCYGVEAASLYYFGKHAEDLAPEEAAVLIGISNSPSAYDPVSHPDASKNKRDDVLKSMNEVGYLSNEDYEKAVSSPLKIVQKETEGTDENYQSSYAIHCAALELMKMDGFEFQYTFDNKEDYTLYSERYTAAYSEQSDRIRAGGFQIYTSLDSGLQAVLQTQIDASLSGFTELQENGKFALQGAGVIVDNKTNYVTAIVGGRGAEDPFNRAYLSARQPGSTIKPLIDYGPAFDTGEYYPTRMVNDHKWEKGPSNSGRRYFGNVTVREALNRSLNTVAWQILEDIGIDFGLSYLGEMEFQKLSYVDNQVP